MRNLKTHTSLIFFSLTFLLTWACWIPAALLPSTGNETLIRLLHYAGGAMPTVATLLLLFTLTDRDERADYWRRLLALKQVGGGWYAVIFLTVPILTVLAGGIDFLLGGEGAQLHTLINLIRHPLSLIPFAVFLLLFGPVTEEMAWRGYALNDLQKKRSALVSSLLLGMLWTVWHLPLFWIEGSYQQGLGVGTVSFWLYMLDKIPQSILMTWIYNNNRRVTATAILFHFMINFVGELADLTRRAEVFYITSWWAVALLVVLIYKPKRLVREASPSE